MLSNPRHRSRVAVFVDWQNVYRTAREAFGLCGMAGEHGNFSPYRLARLLAAANGRGAGGELVRVEIHRGLPSPRQDPVSYAANRRHSALWMDEAPEIVIPRLRPLAYPPTFPDEPAVEKGIDVSLALGALELVLRGRCDVAVVFSHDADLAPLPEAIARVAGSHRVETASWRSATFTARLRGGPAVHHHHISETVFRAVATPVRLAARTAVGTGA